LVPSCQRHVGITSFPDNLAILHHVAILVCRQSFRRQAFRLKAFAGIPITDDNRKIRLSGRCVLVFPRSCPSSCRSFITCRARLPRCHQLLFKPASRDLTLVFTLYL
jgi:hypothetical protein